MKIIAPAVLALSLIAAPSAMAGGCNGAGHKHSPEEMAKIPKVQAQSSEEAMVDAEPMSESQHGEKRRAEEDVDEDLEAGRFHGSASSSAAFCLDAFISFIPLANGSIKAFLKNAISASP